MSSSWSLTTALCLGALALGAWIVLSSSGLQADTIKTSHVFVLNNGAQIQGNLSADSNDDEVVIDFAGLGIVRLARTSVQSIEAKVGTVTLPDATPAAQNPAEVLSAEPKPAIVTRAERSRERAALARAQELRALIDFHISELNRQRSRNRWRAESHLIAIGEPAVPHLIEAAKHSNENVRRAVFRIFLALDDERAIPVAVSALTDSDIFVRENAIELLRDLTAVRLPYRADATPRELERAAARWSAALPAPAK
ncbi:MAG: HEAT repeat domain-containing protein [Planctomycetota bacterium]